VLSPVHDHPSLSHPDLIVGIATGDDAGVYSLGDGRALVQTVDIFTPVVDAPNDWGRIAAANALSDIYAMGGTPLTALQYLAWPRDVLPFDLASEVIRGGMDVMASAGCTVVGGHSIDSPEPTYGFAVTGTVAHDDLVTNSGGRAGDALVLTKPLGIGIITTAIKRGICPPELEAVAIDQMTALNRDAGRALVAHGASAATDITGFGFIGHLRELCHASGVGADVTFDDVPLMDGVMDLLDRGAWAGGSQRNLDSIRDEVVTDLDERSMKLLADAQTSGGLLVALAPENADGYCSAIAGSAKVGILTDDTTIRLS
jgi:selenide,water dikinase